MGVWGAGLYASDLASDMRPLITSIARLPLDDSDIARIVRDAFPEAAENPDDEDHTTFWLVLADQMAKKGIDCADTRAMAIGIIDDGSDERMMAELGMEPADLRKRSRQLQTLREAIAGSPAAKPRKTIKKPQELIMQPGDCLVYPTSAGKCLNSYFASPEDQPSWRQDGWGAAIVLQAERTLGYLAWYRLGVTGTGYSKQPGIGTIAKAAILERPEAGTCSPVHFRRLGLEKIGHFELDREAVARLLPEAGYGSSGDTAAIHNISICNHLSGPTLGQIPFLPALASFFGGRNASFTQIPLATITA